MRRAERESSITTLDHAGGEEGKRVDRVMSSGCALSLLVLALVCGINVVATARRIPPPPRMPPEIPQDVVVRLEQRMSGVRDALRTRAIRGALGYIADLPPTELRTSHEGMQEYFLTQFALVPWVVEPETNDCQWIVANLHTKPISERMPPGFRVVEDFGGGVWLLEKTGQ